MRTILFAAAAVLLAGCDTGEGWVPGEDAKYAHAVPEPPQTSAAAAVPLAAPRAATVAPSPSPEMHPINAAPAPPVPLVNTHCQAVARQRAADARANGYSFEMEDTIYDGTYKDCVDWDSRHSH